MPPPRWHRCRSNPFPKHVPPIARPRGRSRHGDEVLVAWRENAVLPAKTQVARIPRLPGPRVCDSHGNVWRKQCLPDFLFRIPLSCEFETRGPGVITRPEPSIPHPRNLPAPGGCVCHFVAAGGRMRTGRRWSHNSSWHQRENKNVGIRHLTRFDRSIMHSIEQRITHTPLIGYETARS